MLKQYKLMTLSLLAGMVIIGSGCRKWLDVNENPNIASDVPVGMLLSSAEISAASVMGVDIQINGSIWAQHWTQGTSSSQYRTLEQYQPNASNYDRVWTLLYAGALQDLQQVKKKAQAANQRDYEAVSQLMMAYLFQVTTDAWGDVPFSDAFRGETADGAVFDPRFDSQERIYNGINAMIDSSRAIIDRLDAAGVHTLGATNADYNGDFIYQGDLDLWRKFANTLQLKVNLRLSERAPAQAQAGVSKAYAAAGGKAGFIAPGESALINFSSTALNQNPLYAEIVGLNRTQNIVASSTVTTQMNDNNDLRAYALFTYLPSNGLVTGIPQGAYNLPSSTPVSIPTAYTGARAQDATSANAAVRFISDYESLFLQAEAAARGWTDDNDEDLYYDGITASFNALAGPLQSEIEEPVDDAIYIYLNGDTTAGTPVGEWAQYPTAGSLTQKIRHIITQKWFSFTGTQGFEAWTEWRRTGYPDFFTISVNSIIGSQFPSRFLYPSVELTRNANFPGQQFTTQRVWWDIN